MHWMFLLLIASALMVGGSALFYLWTRWKRFEWMPQPLCRRNTLAALPVVALLAWWMVSLNGLVVIVHLALAWLLSDGIAACFQRKNRRYYAGYAALLLTALYLGYGYYACLHLFATHYALSTEKWSSGERLRIALIADAHLGTTFDGAGFAARLAEIAAEKPDVLVIAGDWVDDGTTRNDLKIAAEALRTFPAPLGKYFVFGNHDKGYFRKTFHSGEVVDALNGAGVKVLRDEAVDAGAHWTIIGRRDRSEKPRQSAAELLNKTAPGRYKIVLNHQPTDYEAEAAAGADLVLSGHTHGGQLFPLGWISRALANSSVYGLKRLEKTDFIVTSGISDWALAFKTGCFSEYVIIDVCGAN